MTLSTFIRFLGCLVIVFFLVEVIEPSVAFVRADQCAESSAAVFPIAQFHHHRHANSLIRPDQEKAREQTRSHTDDNRGGRKTFSSHAATAVSSHLGLTLSYSAPCEFRIHSVLDSLPPSFQIRPPSLS